VQGQWLIVAGQGTQVFSYPPNYDPYEYKKVYSSNSSTGVVCFESPLAVVYLDTLPDEGLSNCGGPPCGGPGRLVGMHPIWDGTFHVIGGIFNWDGELNWGSRNTINDGVTFTSNGQNCWYPSFIMNAYLNNYNNAVCTSEIDKEIDNIFVNGGIGKFVVQSSSAKNIAITNGAYWYLGGTAKHTSCNNSHVDLLIGNSYGSSVSFSAVNCLFDNVNCCVSNTFPIGPLGTPGFPAPWDWNGFDGFHRVVDFNGGDQPAPWGVVGTRMHFQCCNQYNMGGDYTITGFTQDSVTLDATIHTTLTALPPNVQGSPSGFVGEARDDQARIWSCVNCTGTTPDSDADARDFSQAGAQGVPLWTYSSRTYTCLNNVANVANSIDINNSPLIHVMGTFVSLTVNVTRADTTGNTGVTGTSAKFNNLPIDDQVAMMTAIFPWTVDLTHTGVRTITPTTTSGSVGGDILAVPTPGVNAHMTGDPISGIYPNNVVNGVAAQCPVVTVTYRASR
jgi:hypothetical protein